MRYRRLFQPGASYFFTLVTHERSPIFRDSSAVDLYRRAVRKVRASRPFSLDAEPVLPDHIHLLVTLPDGDADFPTRVRLIKTAFTRSILGHRRSHDGPSESRIAKGEQAIWQRRYWEHMIRDERDFQAHLDYIHINPVKHGLVAAVRLAALHVLAWVERGTYEPWWGSDEMPPLPDWVASELGWRVACRLG